MKAINTTTQREFNFKIIKNLILKNPPAVNLPYVVDHYARFSRISIQNPKNRHALYMKILRFLKKLEAAEHVKIFKDQGFLQVQPRESLLLLTAFPCDQVVLKKGIAILKPTPSGHAGFTLSPKLAKTQKKRHFEWWKSQRLLCYRVLNKEGWKMLNQNFTAYQENVSHKYLVFKKHETNDYKTMPYTHRFLEKRLKEKIWDYNNAWEIAQDNGFKEGVFLTVTFPPGKTLGEINEASSRNYNTLMAWIVKKVGFRPKYIKVVEFQNRGTIHFHVIFFGIGRIADKFTELTPELQRIGFGKINYICKIERKSLHSNRWAWSGQPPKDCNTNNVRSHLKKYLEKAIEMHNKTAMYWATDKMFFTMSKIFIVETNNKQARIIQGWIFIGVYALGEIPDFVWNNLIELPGQPPPP